MIMKYKYTYDWKPDTPDFRDLKFSPAPIELPHRVDLSRQVTYTYDQLRLGSCTGNAISLALDFTRFKEGLPPIQPSRLFIYYGEREIENTIPYDSGAMLRDGIKVLYNAGAPPETYWPYKIAKFRVKPTAQAYAAAVPNKIDIYERLNNTNINELKACLASGFTFVLGFAVYESFESQAVASTGWVPMPAPTEKMLGGHAVCCVGYDDERQQFKLRNSWGSTWGNKGHFYLPFDYITNPNLAADFWTIKLS